MNCETNNNMFVKDSSIMLFGKKIPVPEYHIPATSQKGCQIQANSTPMNSCSNTKHTGVEIFHTENYEKSKTSSKVNNSIPLEEKKETSNTDQEKVLKKPDKIVQCPRCNSFDTKFCYFNNYNVNQPRHFCRNCHRYWTAGGTMRSVPVGSGRRKNKHIASQYRHIIATSNGNPIERLDIENSSRYQNVSTDKSIVLKFGQFGHDTSFREEEESSLCVSSISNGYTRGNELFESEYNRSNSLQSYPASQWMVPLNQSWNNASSMAQSSMQWCHAPMVAVKNILTPKIPLQFVHGSYWHGNGTVSIGSNGCISPSSTSSNSCCSGNGSPILEKKPDSRVFVPKTLRISETNLE